MNTYGLWRSGGDTATIEAKTTYDAVCQFLSGLGIKEKPRYCGGDCFYSRGPAYYTAQHGDSIKVWRKNDDA